MTTGLRNKRQFPWWLLNRIDGLRVRCRLAFARPLCGHTNPRIPSMRCDKRPNHKGIHRSRIVTGRVRTKGAA